MASDHAQPYGRGLETFDDQIDAQRELPQRIGMLKQPHCADTCSHTSNNIAISVARSRAAPMNPTSKNPRHQAGLVQQLAQQQVVHHRHEALSEEERSSCTWRPALCR